MGYLLNSKVFLEVIGFGHIWDNQATFSKLRTLSAITDKLQNRYFDFWHKLLFNDNRVLKQTSKENNIFMQTLIRKVFQIL